MKLIFVILVSLSSEIIAYSYIGCKVYEVTPEQPKHLQALRILHSTPDFDFWSNNNILHSPTRIMVKPTALAPFLSIMKRGKFKHKEIIPDVESFFQDKYPSRCCRLSTFNGTFNTNRYHNYQTIKAYLTHLKNAYSQKVDTFTIGRTIEGRDIWAVKIFSGDERKKKPAILIDAGIHAREWIGPATALYLINQLVEHSGYASLLRSVDWYIVPLLNPDGYEFSHKSDRLWRKNRTKGKICLGVDANRNFDFHWMEGGSSSDECSETYAGKYPFSERESIALKELILNHDNIKLYITLHSFGNYILYPWNYTPTPPYNVAELSQLAKNVTDAIEKVHGTKYVYGTSNQVMYQASGNSEDWAKGKANIGLSYAMELPGGGLTGFDVPEYEIEKVANEAFTGVRVFWNHVTVKFCKDGC